MLSPEELVYAAVRDSNGNIEVVPRMERILIESSGSDDEKKGLKQGVFSPDREQYVWYGMTQC